VVRPGRDDDAAHVRLGLGRSLDPAPMAQGLDERRLHDVLGELGVGRQDVRESQQRLPARRDELLERHPYALPCLTLDGSS
jgi:hypothetical protein